MSEEAFAGQWPGETAEYRAARDVLVQAEHDLSRAVEAVAEQRRVLPLGGAVPENYRFTEGPIEIGETAPARAVRMSELFGEHETLYSFMYAGTGIPCRMSASLIDGSCAAGGGGEGVSGWRFGS